MRATSMLFTAAILYAAVAANEAGADNLHHVPTIHPAVQKTLVADAAARTYTATWLARNLIYTPTNGLSSNPEDCAKYGCTVSAGP